MNPHGYRNYRRTYVETDLNRIMPGWYSAGLPRTTRSYPPCHRQEKWFHQPSLCLLPHRENCETSQYTQSARCCLVNVYFLVGCLWQVQFLLDMHTASFGRVNSLYVRADMTEPSAYRLAMLQVWAPLHVSAKLRLLCHCFRTRKLLFITPGPTAPCAVPPLRWVSQQSLWKLETHSASIAASSVRH